VDDADTVDATTDAAADADAVATVDASDGAASLDAADAASTCFVEDFSSNAAGWSLGTEWQIGATAQGTGHQAGSPDPAADHSGKGDKGVAGVVLAGNYSNAQHAAYYLTSPAIDLSGPGDMQLSFWRWLNCDYDPFTTHTVEVWSGTDWVVLWSNASLGNVQVTDAAWTNVTLDVTAYKNASFRVRFGHKMGKSGNFLAFIMSGWNIDDVAIGSVGSCPR
jgi:large repetitive protein